MSTAAEATRRRDRPHRHRASAYAAAPGRALIALPFWLLIVAIAVYALFPFYWALRSAITPDTELFTTPVQYFPSHPTLGALPRCAELELLPEGAARTRRSSRGR